MLLCLDVYCNHSEAQMDEVLRMVLYHTQTIHHEHKVCNKHFEQHLERSFVVCLLGIVREVFTFLRVASSMEL